MNYSDFILREKKEIYPGTFIIRLKPKQDTIPFSFIPGQYVYLKNPFYLPEEAHPFSISSSPLHNIELEFCIKVYGDWTEKITKLQKQSLLLVSQPEGTFAWEEKDNDVVFLLGGIGISPIMSMLRTFSETSKKPQKITLLYGNRTLQTVAYKEELKLLADTLNLKIVHIYSHLPHDHSWKGYRGFITKKIIQDEILLPQRNTFFIVGPQIFIQKMEDYLATLDIDNKNIKKEILTQKVL